MSKKLENISDYKKKYENVPLALKNLYEMSKGFEYSELSKDMDFSIPKAYFSVRQFGNIRKVLLEQNNRRKVKNPNLKIKLNNFIKLDTLRQNYKYVIGYDGVDNDNCKFSKSFIKLVLGKWNNNNTKINKIRTFLVLNSEKTVKHLNGGIENEKAITKLFDLMENWIFNSKDKHLIENYENLNFYIVSDKHRSIVSKMNRMMVNGFISSNPCTYEKFENQNSKLKEKLNLAINIKEFNKNFNSLKISAINK